MKKIFFVSLLCIAAGCASTDTADSSKVDQQEIHQWLSASLDEETGMTAFEATFRFGGSTGTTLKLSPPSIITVGGKAMKEGKKLLGGAQYSLTEKAGNMGTETVFIFRDTKNKTYENKVHFASPGSFEFPGEVILNIPFSVSWSRPVEAGEILTIQVTVDNQSMLFREETVGALHKEIILDTENINPGTGEIRLILEKTQDHITGTHQGGKLIQSVKTKAQQIHVKKQGSQAWIQPPEKGGGVNTEIQTCMSFTTFL